MSASTISRIIACIPRWSSPGHAAAWLRRCQALHLRPRASPKHNDGSAHSKPITRSGATTTSFLRLNGFCPPATPRSNRHSARHCLTPTSRGFFPWRLSDDGPRCKWKRLHGAVIRNPSHELPSRLRLHHGRCHPDSYRLAATLKSVALGRQATSPHSFSCSTLPASASAGSRATPASAFQLNPNLIFFAGRGNTRVPMLRQTARSHNPSIQ